MIDLLKNKDISTKFEILTKVNFFSAIKKGCALLHMDLFQEEDNFMIFEDDILPVASKMAF